MQLARLVHPRHRPDGPGPLLVVGRRREQPLVRVGGLGEPARGFVERPEFPQGVGHDPGDRIVAAGPPPSRADRAPSRPRPAAPRPAIVGARRVAAVAADDRGQAVGHHRGRRGRSGGRRPSATGRGRSRGIEQDLLECVDGLPRVRGVEVDVGEQQPRLEPFGVACAHMRRPIRAGGSPRPTGVRPRPGRLPHRACGTGGRAPRRPGECRRSSRPAWTLLDRLAVRLQGRVLAADRLGRACQPVIVRRPVGRPGDLVAVAVDQAAVLAEHDQSVRLRDDRDSRRRRRGCPPRCGRSPGA